MPDFVNLVFKAVDIPLVVGIVLLIQVAKKYIKIDSKWWALVLVACGFLAAFLKLDVSTVGIKAYLVQGFVYAAASEFVYQSWRTITTTIKGKK